MRTLRYFEDEARLWQTMAALSYILYEDAMEQGLDEAEYWQEVAAQESARAMAYLDACNIMKGWYHAG